MSFKTNIEGNLLVGTAHYSGSLSSFAGFYGVGIAAAVAIPNFISMQYKSKRAEVLMNVRAIKTAQIAYMQDYDV